MQQEQSSATLFLRGLVMISSLFVFSYLALFGHSLPRGVERFIPADLVAQLQAWIPSIDPPEAHAESFPMDSSLELPTIRASASREIDRVTASSTAYPTSSMIDALSRSLPSLSTDSTNQIEERLKTLGATTYHLEEWGTGEGLYRFVCEMSVDQEHQCRRHFEAVEPSALLAMQKVLAEVEARMAEN